MFAACAFAMKMFRNCSGSCEFGMESGDRVLGFRIGPGRWDRGWAAAQRPILGLRQKYQGLSTSRCSPLSLGTSRL